MKAVFRPGFRPTSSESPASSSSGGHTAGLRASRLMAAATFVMLALSASGAEFSFNALQARAKSLAARSYTPTPTRAPGWLQAYNYSQPGW